LQAQGGSLRDRRSSAHDIHKFPHFIERSAALAAHAVTTRSKLLKWGAWIGAAGILMALLGAAAATWLKREQEADAVTNTQKIARTLEIIRTSTPENRKVLKVLFYGQSITRSGWHNAVVAHWREKYPNTVFVTENRALGGFASQLLVRTTEQDIAAFYPDLIVFHVYGDHRAYEKILRMFRSQTAADVIIQTDHGQVLPDPPCADGLQLTLRPAPGCAGVLWVRQRDWGDEMSYHKIPAFAKKYGMAVEPQRTWWRDLLLRTHTDPRSLLADDIHPNEKGNALIAGFFNQYFDDLVNRWNGETGPNVVSIPADAAQYSEGGTTVNFDGRRIELISTKPLAAWPEITIDGASPKDLDACYQVTRSSPVPSVTDWPAVIRIALQHDHTPEDWTATVTRMSPDQKAFDFTVKASATGDEGSASSGREFVSKSGRLSIDAQDWMFDRAYGLSHVPLQVPFDVNWSVQYVCGGEPEVIERGNGVTEYRYILGAGLGNGTHSLKLSLPAAGLVNVVEFRAYKPPLHEN
jgi:hypothetical protein